jgi:type IV pilus assembly protein PilM
MYALGLHADGHLLKVALLRREKGQICIELVRTFNLQEVNDALFLLTPILAKKKAVIVTGLDAWEVILRDVDIKLKHKKEILSVLPFQSEAQIPYPLEEAILVPFLSNLGKEVSSITILATKKKSLLEHLEKMNAYQIDPDWVSAIPAALWRYAKSYLSKELTSILHLGMEKSSYLSFSNERLVFSQTINFGLSHLLDALQEDAPEKELDAVNFSSLNSTEFPKLSQALEKFKKEQERILAFFEIKGLSQDWALLGDIPLSLRQFLDGEQRKEKGDHPSYAIPIGLALDAIYQDENSIQLRQNIYVSEGQFKKRMKSLVLSFSSIALVFFTTWGSTHFFLKKKEAALIEQAEKYRGKKLEKNREVLLESLHDWSKTLKNKKIPFPYQLTVPKVSDFLAWLSVHPKLNQTGVEIKKIHYSLVKYPLLGKTNIPYQVKVELEFISASPTLAREFHDSLLKGEGLVNPGHEIAWNVNENRYSTTFILKDCPP